MKLRVPEGCGAVSHQGQAVEIAEDGSVEVDDSAWVVLAALGFTKWERRHATEIADMTRDELVLQVMDMTVKATQAIGTEDIRARLLASQEPASSSGQENGAPPIVATNVDVEAIATFTRQALFSFLRAKGVSVTLPITNEELRALARHAVNE